MWEVQLFNHGSDVLFLALKKEKGKKDYTFYSFCTLEEIRTLFKMNSWHFWLQGTVVRKMKKEIKSESQQAHFKSDIGIL